MELFIHIVAALAYMQFTRFFNIFLSYNKQHKKIKDCKSINATKQIDKKEEHIHGIYAMLTYCCSINSTVRKAEKVKRERGNKRKKISGEEKSRKRVCYFKMFISQKIWKLFCDRKFIVFVLEHGSLQ